MKAGMGDHMLNVETGEFDEKSLMVSYQDKAALLNFKYFPKTDLSEQRERQEPRSIPP